METKRVWGKTQIVAALMMIATIGNLIAGSIGTIAPNTAMWIGAICAAVTVFCGRIQGHPAKENEG